MTLRMPNSTTTSKISTSRTAMTPNLKTRIWTRKRMRKKKNDKTERIASLRPLAFRGNRCGSGRPGFLDASGQSVQ